MRFYTAHIREAAAPVLVREGFSWGALLFGPFWLLAHRAWIAGVIVLCADIVLVVADHSLATLAGLLLAWGLGLFGQDIRRWSLSRRGFALEHVVAARDADAAYARLLAARPDLQAMAAP